MRYSLKEIFLQEAAKGPEDLPEGVGVDISPYMGGILIGYDNDTSGVSGYVEMKPARDGCLGAYIIYQSEATKGFGPLLYDLALEVAGPKGVTADRGSVSADASNVWKYYYEKRDDVIKKPLDDEEDPKTPPEEDDCDLSVSRAGGAVSFLDAGDEVKRPWLNYVYYASGKPNLQKLKQLGKLQIDPKLLGEGVVPQGSADERPLHGAPTYYYATGRSLPKHLQDNGALKGARKWNKDGGLIDVEKLEDEEEDKDRWYKKEGTNENLELDKERLGLSLEVLRSNSSRSPKVNEKLSRKKGGGRTKREQTERSRKVDWSKIKKQWSSEVLHPQQIDHGLFYYHKDNPDRPIAGVTFATVEWEDNKIAHINMVGVNPKWRGLGLGKALIRDLSKEYGYNNVEWGFTTEQGEKLRKSMEREMEPYRKRGYDMWGRSLKEAFLKEFNALATAAIEASNIPPGAWDRDNAPRVDQKKIKKNKEYVKKLDVTEVEAANGAEVHVDHMDPQYKRQISMLKTPEEVLDWKEPKYLDGRGEHRISQLGYAKIADRKDDLRTDVYLMPYDPNWRRSEDMMQQVIKHWIANHGNPGAYPDPGATMMVSIKEEWEDLRNALKEASEEIYYHGTNQQFSPGDTIDPPLVTGNISEKGRKKNLDKVFFTRDKGSAKIYAGRAVQSLGGEPYVYIVKPVGDVEWLNRTPGTTVLMAPKAVVIEEV